MKSILIIALTLIAFTTASAQSPISQGSVGASTVQASGTVEGKVALPAGEKADGEKSTAGIAPDISANFVGTNDLNLLLLRQAIKMA